MNDEQKIPEQLKNDILNVLKKHLDLTKYHVFLFGSRAEGRAHTQSDFDIGIEGSSQVPLATMAKIHEELQDLHTLYKVDVVDFHFVSDLFREVALQHVSNLTA